MGVQVEELAKVITWFPSAPVSPELFLSQAWKAAAGSGDPALHTGIRVTWCWASRWGLWYGAPICSLVSADLGGVLAGEVLGSRKQHPNAVWL